LSQNRVEVNRRNARKSTGPKTAAGKAVVSRNAVRHGLLSAVLYVEEGEAEELARLRADFLNHFLPEGPLEVLLVDRITANAWRLRKALEAEAWYQSLHAGRFLSGPRVDPPAYELWTDHKYPKDGALEAIFEQGAKFTRYEAFLERSLHKNLHELQRLQASRAGVAVPLPVAVDVEVSGMTGRGEEDGGFVS
jgi:hypothetical protein